MLTCNVIIKLLGNEVGFFQQKEKIETGRNSVSRCLSRQFIWSVRPENDDKLQTYNTHFL